MVEAFKKEVQRRKEEPGFIADNIRGKYLGTVIMVNKSSVRWSYNVKMDGGKILKKVAISHLEPEDWSDRRVKPKKVEVPQLLSKNKVVFDLYETKIEPMLRLGHIRNIQPAGWVRLPRGKYERGSLEDARIKSYSISWLDLEEVESTSISPLVIASYDIECASSHGDFPQACKNYKKLAEDFCDEIFGY